MSITILKDFVGEWPQAQRPAGVQRTNDRKAVTEAPGAMQWHFASYVQERFDTLAPNGH